MIARAGKALGPALKILVPVSVDALRQHGPSAIEVSVQSWIQGPQRRAWRACAAAALTGLAGQPQHGPHDRTACPGRPRRGHRLELIRFRGYRIL